MTDKPPLMKLSGENFPRLEDTGYGRRNTEDNRGELWLDDGPQT